MRQKVSRFALLICLVSFLATACTPEDDPGVALPNPVSVNCEDQGGTLQIESRPDGGQFGVCTFEDNRQCEEWALFYDDCPVGGIKVTGYATEAARFCAITGATYEATGTDAAGVETGTCTLKDGTVCEAGAFYEGTCKAGG